MLSPDFGLWYEVKDGERKQTVGYQAICHATPHVPCGWEGPVRGPLEIVDAIYDVERHMRESRRVDENGSETWHSVSVEKLVKA